MEYYSAFKRGEILTFLTTWMNLVEIMLGKINQVQKDKSHMILLKTNQAQKDKNYIILLKINQAQKDKNHIILLTCRICKS